MSKKKIAISLALSLVFLLVIPMSFVCFDLATENPFDETYYGELYYMHQKLKNTEGKKIVVLGNSNIAFGVDSKLLEEKLREAYLDYSVCNFGLYGSIGTKAMLDLSKKEIKKGDIVILAPEMVGQSLSLYFSATELYRAIAEDESMMFELESSSLKTMIGNYSNYLSDKYVYLHNSSIESINTVYKRSSFDENCDLKNYPRDYNIMNHLVDRNVDITFDTAYLEDEFLEYLNDYYADIHNLGAEMYFSFPPMNEKAIKSTDEEILEFYNYLDDRIDFRIISNPHNYIYEAEWFYNTNFHLNDKGVILRTNQLLSDIKNELGNNTANGISLPEMPEVPKDDNEVGNNDYLKYFNVEDDAIISLTEEGKKLKRIIVPYNSGETKITSFSKDVFANDSSIEEIVIQDNIDIILDNSFNGCASLKGIYLEHLTPDDISVGYRALEGCSAKFYVYDQCLVAFLKDYSWGYYAKSLASYEGGDQDE